MISAIALASAFAGCTDEPFVNEGLKAKPEMEFLVNDDGVWQSRAGEGGESEPQNYFGGSLRMIDEDGCGESGDTIYLHRFVEDAIRHDAVSGGKTSSRAAVNSVNDLSTFYVTAAHYKGTWDEKETLANYMCDVPFTKSGSVWTPSADYRWLPNGKTRIFAYAPAANEYLTLSDPSTPGSPKINYNAYDETVDLVVAKTGEISGLPDEIPVLNFKHILTCVKFKLNNNLAGTLSSIVLDGIYGVGTYSMADDNEGWNVDTSKSYKYTLSLNEPISSNDNKDKEFATIYLLPQTTKSTAKISMTFTEPQSGAYKTLTVKINEQVWEPGTTVTYLLSTEKITVTSKIRCVNVSDDLTTTPDDWNNLSEFTALKLPGGEFYKKFRVIAENSITYSGNATADNNGSYHACVGLNYEFVNASSHAKISKPSWIDFEILNENKYGSLVAVRMNSNQNRVAATNTGNKILAEAAEVGTGSPVDLSYVFDGLRNTANCYVVNNPGNYTFPAVYGNSYYEGELHELAYSNTSISNTDGAYALTGFRNIDGQKIKRPWIDDDIACWSNMTPIAGAKIVWQDSPGLVENVAYNSTTKMVTFSVPKENIRQGNAVIAVYDQEGAIVWSWHIWVTHINIYDYENNFYAGCFDCLSYYLGWCEPERYSFTQRSVGIHFWMNDSEGNKVAEQYLDITHLGGTFTDSYGNAPSYQYGRKDPIPPAIYYSGEWQYKSVTPAIEQRKFRASTFTYAHSGSTPMQYPTQFAQGSSYEWSAQAFFNLWGASAPGSNIVETYSKTIYDPCPPGFRVPSKDEFDISTFSNVSLNGNKWEVTDPNGKKVEFPVLPNYSPRTGNFKVDSYKSLYLRTTQMTVSSSWQYNLCAKFATNNSITEKCAWTKDYNVSSGYYICPTYDLMLPKIPETDGYYDSWGNLYPLVSNPNFYQDYDGNWWPYAEYEDYYYQDSDGIWHEY